MSDDIQRDGQVVTFYSYKGGTGRTMALANVAWILAANGKRVLVVDWDLESPGLPRFYAPFLRPDRLETAEGVVEMVREFEWAASREQRRDPGWYSFHTNVRRFAISLDWPSFPDGATLDLLPAGRQNNDYAVALNAMDWDDFYERLGGGAFFESLRRDMKRHYDYVLIDSRTGLSDVADICTMLMPDVLVDCFTFSEQGISGAAQVARAIASYTRRDIRILPVPMRVDPAEKAKADAGRVVAKQRFAGLPTGMGEAERDRYWAAIQVPYQAFYSYEETLATFGDAPGSRSTMLSAYEALTGYITNGEITALPPIDEQVRRRTMDRFERKLMPFEDLVILRHEPRDQVWAEWIASVLTAAGVEVHLRPDGQDEESDPPYGRDLLVVSRSETAAAPSTGPAPLVVHVSDTTKPAGIASSNSAHIGGRREDGAIAHLLRLVGRSDATAVVMDSRRPRFPGAEPIVFDAPNRNPRFTGRDEDLRALRAHLLQAGPTGSSHDAKVVALQGMGGVGKTQVAIEYAHRFRGAYDIVWWMAADPFSFVDVRLSELGRALDLPPQPTTAEDVRLVLQALSRGTPSSRWLLIFDNAEDVRIAEFLPRGAGHVLMTSRDSTWSDRAQVQHVDMFERRESITHLLLRVPTMTGEDAGRLADALGDLPIAIAAAGALLSETGVPVADYLQEIDRVGVGIGETSVAAVWDMSLQRLRDRSPSAYRMLQLFSVMDTNISLEVAYSDQFAAALRSVDPAVSEPLVRARLVQQINRLALLKLDTQRASGSGQVIVHRLLQGVVRTRMSEQDLADTRHQVHLILAAFRPGGEVDDPASWPRLRQIWPHVEVSQAWSCLDGDVRGLLIDRVRYLMAVGDNPRAWDRAEQTERAWADDLASRPMDDSFSDALRVHLLQLRSTKAAILRDLGRYAQAQDLDGQTLSEQVNLLGPEHPHTLMTAGGLAADLRGLGRYAEALERAQEVYHRWSDNFGESNPRTLAALADVATSYRLLGDFRAALSRDEIAHRQRRGALGDRHPATLASAGALGRDHRDAGDYERSDALLRKTAADYEELLAESRAAVNARVDWAVTLRCLGRAAEAVPLLENAYMRLSEVSSDSPETLACRTSLGLAYLAVNEQDQAEHHLRAAAQAYSSLLGPRHPHTLICAVNLAVIGRSREAAARAAQELKEVLGADHPHTIAALTNEAVFTAEAANYSRAAAILDDVADRAAEALGNDHPDTIRCEADRELVRRALGGADDLDRAMGRLTAALGRHHPSVAVLREGRYLHRVIDPQPF